MRYLSSSNSDNILIIFYINHDKNFNILIRYFDLINRNRVLRENFVATNENSHSKILTMNYLSLKCERLWRYVCTFVLLLKAILEDKNEWIF